MANLENLAKLIDSRHACIRIATTEEAYVLELIRRCADAIGLELRIWSLSDGWMVGPVHKQRPLADTEPAAAALWWLRREPVTGISVMRDLAVHLDDPKTLRLFRDLIEQAEATGCTLILIDHAAKLPAIIEAHSTLLELELPDDDEVVDLIKQTVREARQRQRITANVSKAQLNAMVRNLQGLHRRHIRRAVTDAISNDRRLDAADINHLLAHKRRLLHQDGLLEFVESPIDLRDIAGFAKLKRWLKLREAAMTEQGRNAGLQPPRGVLMLGVPGAGKSMCAKAVATAWQRPLLRLDPSVLYDRYVGESERRLRHALRQAEAMSPIVLWIDEIEKGFASSSAQSVGGGLSQRMFGTFLTWLQENNQPVFLFATANNIDALPPELMRKGRFDEIFFVDLPGKAIRRAVFEIHLRRRGQDLSACELPVLAEESAGRTGAEIEQAVVGALHEAFATGEKLTTELLLRIMHDSPPLSVTMAERIDALREWAATRCVAVD